MRERAGKRFVSLISVTNDFVENNENAARLFHHMLE
jgi:hypothetical protein